MRVIMNNRYDDFFNNDPWLDIASGTYPHGRRLYKKDERFWVSINGDGQLLFFIHDLGGESVSCLINITGINISIEKAPSGAYRLVCTLTDADLEMKEKFSIVAKDIAHHCSPFHGMQLFIKVQDRIKSWANFLRPTRSGLTHAEFVGFWGELYSISQILMKYHDPAEVLRFWVGPEGKKQDITLNSIAIEVKTTMSGDPQTIRVSSIEQLERVSEYLYLLHIIATPSNNKLGLSLEMLYSKCLGCLTHDVSAETIFLQKTSELYGKANEAQLNDMFSIASVSLFDVRNDFPLISRDDISCGVASVQYEIFTSFIKKFDVTEDMERIIKNG